MSDNEAIISTFAQWTRGLGELTPFDTVASTITATLLTLKFLSYIYLVFSLKIRRKKNISIHDHSSIYFSSRSFCHRRWFALQKSIKTAANAYFRSLVDQEVKRGKKLEDQHRRFIFCFFVFRRFGQSWITGRAYDIPDATRD